MIRLLSLLFLLSSTACRSPIDHERSLSDHYVFIFTGAESRKPLDPIDKNVFALEAAHSYNEFRKRGIPADNIFVLYSDTLPDFKDPAFNEIDKSFKNEFKSSYSNKATISNLLKLESLLDDKLNAKSVFHLLMNAHGRVDSAGFYMYSETDDRFIRADIINEMLEDNRGYTHLYVGSCYSGQLLKEIDEGLGILVTGANDKGSCWLDRENSFGRLYFSNLPKDLNPFEYNLSFKVAKEEYKNWGKDRHNFIHNDYKTNRKDELGTLVWDPQIKIFK